MKKRHRYKLKQKYYSKPLYKVLNDLTECEKCGETDIEKLTRHHKILQSKGGSDFPENIQILCEDCHNKKHNK